VKIQEKNYGVEEEIPGVGLSLVWA